jgi:hypothetical protein
MSLKDSNAKKNYTNVAPLPTKRGKIHYGKLKIKEAFEPIGKVIKTAADWLKEDFKRAKKESRDPKWINPRHQPGYGRKKKDWKDIH